MTTGQERRADAPRSPRRPGRKARDRSVALVLIGTILLMPPIAGISLIDGRIAGLPVPLLYLFTVWLVLIVWAWRLSRALHQHVDAPVAMEGSEGER